MGLVLKGGIWYLVGRVGSAMRTYRVSRVLAVRPNGERFERAAEFDLAAYWADSIVAYEGSRATVEAVFRCRPEDMEAVGDIVGMRRLGRSTAVPDPDDPSLVQLHLAFDWIDQAQAAAFGLGHLVEVLAPPELRAQLVKVARAVLLRYSTSDAPSASPETDPAPSGADATSHEPAAAAEPVAAAEPAMAAEPALAASAASA